MTARSKLFAATQPLVARLARGDRAALARAKTPHGAPGSATPRHSASARTPRSKAQLVEQMSGTIIAEANQPAGTSFQITLPAHTEC